MSSPTARRSWPSTRPPGRSGPSSRSCATPRAWPSTRTGRIYVGVGDPENQVKVFHPDGKLAPRHRPPRRPPPAGTLAAGRHGVRAGSPWTAGQALGHGSRHARPSGSARGTPKTGKFVREFFGPTAYGALGGAINPLDPCLMVGHGCEWRIDPARPAAQRAWAASSATACRTPASASAPTAGCTWPWPPAGRTRPPTCGSSSGSATANTSSAAMFTLPGEGQRQAKTTVLGRRERRRPAAARRSDYHRRPRALQRLVHELCARPDASTPTTGSTRSPASPPAGRRSTTWPIPSKMPAAGMGSADGRRVLTIGEYGVSESWMDCFDIASGKEALELSGQLRRRARLAPGLPAGGGHGPRLVRPVRRRQIARSDRQRLGALPTNVGEWHILTEDGLLPDAALPGRSDEGRSGRPRPCRAPCWTMSRRAWAARISAARAASPATASSTSRPARPASGTSKSSGSTRSSASSGGRSRDLAQRRGRGRGDPRQR